MLVEAATDHYVPHDALSICFSPTSHLGELAFSSPIAYFLLLKQGAIMCSELPLIFIGCTLLSY